MVRSLPPGISRHGQRFRIDVVVRGRRIRESFASLEEAMRARVRCQELARNLPRRLPLFAELVEEVYESTTDLRPETRRYWRSKFDYLLRVFEPGLRLHEFTEAMIRRFLAAELQRKSSTTVAKYYAALSRLFRFALNRGYLAVSPLRGIRKPKEAPRRLDFFTPEELVAIVARIRASGLPAAQAHADVVEFLYRTGLRRAELSRLCPPDLDLDRGTVFVRGKTEDRTLPILPDVAPLAARVAGMLPITIHAIDNVFDRWADRLGLPRSRFRAHAMRHSFASALVRAGTPLATVARLMGHKDTMLVSRYYHATAPEMLDALRHLTPPPEAGS